VAKTPKNSEFYDFLALFWRSNPQVVNSSLKGIMSVKKMEKTA